MGRWRLRRDRRWGARRLGEEGLVLGEGEGEGRVIMALVGEGGWEGNMVVAEEGG